MKIIQRPYIPWEIEIKLYNWRAFMLIVKWKWTMLKDHINICSCSSSHRGNIIVFVGVNRNLITPLVLRMSHLFLMRLIQYMEDHEMLSTCCHVGRHVDFSSIHISLVLMPYGVIEITMKKCTPWSRFLVQDKVIWGNGWYGRQDGETKQNC